MTRTLAIIAVLLGQTAVVCAPFSLNVCTHSDGRSHFEFSHSKCRHDHPAGALHDDKLVENAAAEEHDCGNCKDRPVVVDQSMQRLASGKVFVTLACACPTADSPIDILAGLTRLPNSRQASLPTSSILAELANIVLRC